MKLVILGSGTSVPHAKRSSSCYWLETAGGSRLLLDASGDAPHRMAEEQLDWSNLDAIWISHFHWDHFAGLPSLLFGMKWAPKTQKRTKGMRIVGGKGLRDMLEQLNETNNFKLLDQGFSVEVVEVDPGQEFELTRGLSANVMTTRHKKESLALRVVDTDKKSLVYTSDTGFSEELIPFCSGADVLLMECSYRKDKPVQTHLELSEAMKIASSSAPGKLVLTHLSAQWDQFDVAEEAGRMWSGTTIEATEGLRLII
jgi:ribonuclease BN (tRNA processing enzyme)